MTKSALRWGAALLVFAGAVPIAQAQVITNGEIERGLRFPGTTPFDGETYTQRYSQGLGAANVYLNGDSRRLYYLDYLDRLDRAEKFGYRMPIDPFCETPPAPPPQAISAPVQGSVTVGGGFGFWRRR